MSDIFCIRDFMNYPFLIRHNTQIGCKASHWCERTESICKLLWWVNWDEVPSKKWFRADCKSQFARDTSQHLRTRHRVDLTATDCKSNKVLEVHPIEVDIGRHNSEVIPEGIRPGDWSKTKSIEVYFKWVVHELKCYQSRHQRDLPINNPIEPNHDARRNSRSHMSTWIASPALLNVALCPWFLGSSSDQCNRHCQDHKQAHTCKWSAHTEVQSRIPKHTSLTLIQIGDGSSYPFNFYLTQ
jgi:hypothetical protein